MSNENLEDLLMNEMKVIFKYLIKIGAKKEDAEDIVQDTVCKAIINIDSIDEEKIVSWLFKVSINSYYNLYNKNKKKDEYVMFQEVDIGQLMNDIYIEEQILNKELNEYINIALNTLKPSYSNLLKLKYFMNLSYKEISSLLDINEDQVKTYLYRARNKFKEVWEGLSYGR